MRVWQFEALWDGGQWLSPGIAVVDEVGHLVHLGDSVPAHAQDASRERVAGWALPGFTNAHSHAFQYAMAGTAEYLRGEQDDFWSWREAMYRLALTVSPEHMEAVATMLYAEMVRHGYTHVAEFHYLHHDLDGQPYADRATMARALMRAAATAGIALCLIPIYYHTSDFGKPASAGQRRFISRGPDDFGQLLADSRAAAHTFSRVRVGLGVHSLRAAPGDHVRQIYANAPAAVPRHIHVAEQQKEVAGCLNDTSARPVRWLLENLALGPRDHLVHATHMDKSETRDLAQSGAHVVVCPSTEGNLGDGFFSLDPYRRAGGRWSIGTDSHVGLSPLEELRWLDYGQRLRLEQRNIVCHKAGEDSGTRLFQEALAGGRAACGASPVTWPLGDPFDAVVVNPQFPPLATAPAERRLGIIIYAGDPSLWLGTITAGQWRVQHGLHCQGPQIYRRYQAALTHLRNG